MALKNYEWRGYTWQFEESEAPADARPLEPPRPKARGGRPTKAELAAKLTNPELAQAVQAKAAKKAADKAAKAPADKSAAKKAR